MMTIEGLLKNIASDAATRQKVVSELWRLIAVHWIAADVSRPLSLTTTIWVKKSRRSHGTLEIFPGDLVTVDGRQATYEQALSSGKVNVRFHDDNALQTVSAAKLETPQKAKKKPKPPEPLTETQYQIAQQRLKIIQPILRTSGSIKPVLYEQAHHHDVSERTIRRWLSEWRREEHLSALAPRRTLRRQSRTDPNVETVIRDVI